MKLRTLSLAAAFLVATALPAKADIGTILSGTFTGGNNFSTSFSVLMEYCFDAEACPAAGTNMFYVGVLISNQGSYGEVFKAIGLVNIPAGASVDGSTAPYANTLAGWGTPPPQELGGAGIPGDTWSWIAPSPAPTNGLKVADGEQWFVYRISNVTLAQVQALGVGVHAISGPNNCSTKLAAWNGGATTNDVGEGNYNPECGTTTIPEPVTMVLMGTGLAGIAAARRRRNGLELVDENGQDIEV